MKYLDKAGLSRLWANLKPKLTGKEDKSNKVTSITSSSTDIQYPSAKAVYNALQNSSGSSAVLINSTESDTSIVNKLYSLINDDYSYKQPGIFIEDEHMSSDVICTIFYFATIQKLDDSTDIFGFLGNAGFKIFTVDKNTHTFTPMNAYYSDIFESTGNKVTTISSSSSDDEYPSAKAVYDALQNNSNTMLDLVYPVGSYYETSNTSFDPNITWGGTWELEVDGTVLVSKSTTSGSKFNVAVGTVIGEETHTLTVNEMPSHTHLYRASIGAGNAEGSLNFGNINGGVITGQWGNAIQSSGDSQPHNIVQPSKVVNRWHRTA